MIEKPTWKLVGATVLAIVLFFVLVSCLPCVAHGATRGKWRTDYPKSTVARGRWIEARCHHWGDVLRMKPRKVRWWAELGRRVSWLEASYMRYSPYKSAKAYFRNPRHPRDRGIMQQSHGSPWQLSIPDYQCYRFMLMARNGGWHVIDEQFSTARRARAAMH